MAGAIPGDGGRTYTPSVSRPRLAAKTRRSDCLTIWGMNNFRGRAAQRGT